MSGRMFIHATNVHQGGGRSLLTALLRALREETEFVLSVDDRMPIQDDMVRNIQIKRVKPSVARRLDAERWLARSVTRGDIVLCFGNLPPLFKLRGHTIVFVQNRYLIDGVKLRQLPLRVRLRLAIERLWFSRNMAHVDELIVQTPAMKRLLEIKTRGRVPVRVLPFVAEPNGYARCVPQPKLQKETDCSFIYVASGEPHKNHRQLVEAWCLLAKDGLFPSLTLTLNKTHFAGLCLWIEQKIEQCRLNVANLGGVTHGEIKKLYARADALIYPSTFESFGLPLVEARQAGLPVLASELDYVRDVLDPEQTFDPGSAVSIARAVKRFMGIEEPSLPLQDAAGFMRHILEETE